MTNTPKKSIRPRGGMTLVEVIVSLGVIALAATMLMMAYGGAMNVLRRSADRQQAGDSAYALVEGQQDATAAPGTVTFRVGGRTYTVDGQFFTAQQDGTQFRAFVPD